MMLMLSAILQALVPPAEYLLPVYGKVQAVWKDPTFEWLSIILGCFACILLTWSFLYMLAFLSWKTLSLMGKIIGGFADFLRKSVMVVLYGLSACLVLVFFGVYFRVRLILRCALFVAYAFWTPFYIYRFGLPAKERLTAMQFDLLNHTQRVFDRLPDQNRVFMLEIWADVLSHSMANYPLRQFDGVFASIKNLTLANQDRKVLLERINPCVADWEGLANTRAQMCK